MATRKKRGKRAGRSAARRAASGSVLPAGRRAALVATSEGSAKRPRTPAQLAALKAHQFKPGQSGNPSGRPRSLAEFREAIRERCGEKALKALDQLLGSSSSTAKARAVEIALGYAWGKPSVAVEVTGTGGSALKHEVEGGGLVELFKRLAGEEPTEPVAAPSPAEPAQPTGEPKS